MHTVKRIAARICLFAIVSGLLQPSGRAAVPFEFQICGKYMIVLPVLVNDRGPYNFVLDIGATTTMLSAELSDELALKPQDRVTLISPAGQTAVPRSLIDRVSLGGNIAEIRDLEVLWMDLTACRRLHPDVRGVLGQNFLRNFNFVLDYRRRKLWIEEGSELTKAIRGTAAEMQVEETGFLIEARIAGPGARPVRLMLDSGTAQLVLFDKPQEPSFKPLIGPTKQVTLTGNSQERPVELGSLSRLQIGGKSLTALPVVLVPQEAALDRPEDGLMPTHLFRSVFFQMRGRYVVFNAGWNPE